MMKTKKSFFERLTGAKKIEEEERGRRGSMPIYSEEEESEMVMKKHKAFILFPAGR